MHTLRFGVATADHQCEAYDGRDDIRDVWERVRGLVARGKATDFWNRYREDVELARGLGCSVFRLSLSWARLEPQPDAWSDEAFAHYRDVLQAIRDAGMSAIVTLVHNTWPLHVQAAGSGAGPLDPSFPDRVARFATEVAQRLGDLIDDYVTLNEPNQLVYGWIKGFWMRAYAMPPGQPPYESGDAQMDDVLTLIPNLFRAHAKARDAIRRIRPNARVGTNPLVLGLPQWLQRWIDRNATHLQSPEDAKRQAARIAQSGVRRRRPRRLLDRAAHHDARAAAARLLFGAVLLRAPRGAARKHRPRLPQTRKSGAGRVAVVADTLPASIVGGWFPAATIRYVNAMPDAVDALRRGEVDAVFDDDVTLRAVRRRCARSHAASGLASSTLPSRWRSAAARCSTSSIVPSASCGASIPRFPNAFNRKTVAHIGREEEAQADAKRAVPEMDRSIERIRKRGVLRVGIHPGVPGSLHRVTVTASAATTGSSRRSRGASRSSSSAIPIASSSCR